MEYHFPIQVKMLFGSHYISTVCVFSSVLRIDNGPDSMFLGALQTP